MLVAAGAATGIGLFRWIRWQASQRELDRQNIRLWRGAVLDTRPVAERMRQVRTDYLHAFAGRPHDAEQRKERIIRARGEVRARSYFCKSSEEAANPDFPPSSH
jgi:hypothetical protein